MANRKFAKAASPLKKTSELPDLLEQIAVGIAQELVTGKTVLKGELDINTKCTVLKTLIAYRATDEKLEAPEEEGGAFNGYRKGLSAAGGSGTGNPAGTVGRGFAPPSLTLLSGGGSVDQSGDGADDEDSDPSGEEGEGDDGAAEAGD